MLKEWETPKPDTYKLPDITKIAYYHELAICSGSGGGGGSGNSNWCPSAVSL